MRKIYIYRPLSLLYFRSDFKKQDKTIAIIKVPNDMEQTVLYLPVKCELVDAKGQFNQVGEFPRE